jgi:hypothetical protein
VLLARGVRAVGNIAEAAMATREYTHISGSEIHVSDVESNIPLEITNLLVQILDVRLEFGVLRVEICSLWLADSLGTTSEQLRVSFAVPITYKLAAENSEISFGEKVPISSRFGCSKFRTQIL